MKLTNIRFLWRISNFGDLSGAGGLKRSGRWHNRGRKVIYLADSSTGALLEILVHLEIDSDDVPDSFKLLQISIPESFEITELTPPPGNDWKNDEELTQRLGDEWLAAQTTAVARVPSSIVSGAWNFLLNPDHPDAGKLAIVSITEENYDLRLFRFARNRSR